MNQTALKIALIVVLLSLPLLSRASSVSVQSHIRSITFPVLDGASLRDDFGDPRSGGRTHEGNDLFAAKHHPLVAAVDGYVQYVVYPQASYGYSVGLVDADGYRYHYLHINNDSLGTDSGNGGPKLAYAPGITAGAPVFKGQLIGWVGDSGNAERTSPHLHFEIRDRDGDPINPYPSLVRATRISRVAPTPALPNEILPYGGFTGGARIALSNVDANDPSDELITAPGPGGGPIVRVYNTAQRLTAQFRAFDSSMRAGMDVAGGDTDGDGTDEIIVAPDRGALPEVRIFSVTGTLLSSFNAYATSFKGGVRVTTADLDADGRDEIITAPGAGGGPHVKVFRGDGTRISQFFAYGTGFRGGVDVAAYPATDATPAVIVTAAGRSGGPHVRVFTPDGTRLAQFFSGSESFRGGLRLSVADLLTDTIDPEIITVTETNGRPIARVYSLSGAPITSFREFEFWWTGGYDVAAGTGALWMSSTEGGRRASVRSVTQ
jgi:hypothetical protein